MKYVKITDWYDVSYVVEISDDLAENYSEQFSPTDYSESSKEVVGLRPNHLPEYVKTQCTLPKDTIEDAWNATEEDDFEN